MAVELLEWSKQEVTTLLVQRLHYAQPTDHQWAKRVKTLRFVPLMGVLLSCGKVRHILAPASANCLEHQTVNELVICGKDSDLSGCAVGRIELFCVNVA